MAGGGTVGPSTSNPSGSSAKVLLVIRRFWPLCDDAAGRLSLLADGLRRSGFIPTILTARYSNAWPLEFMFREVEVLRPLSAPKSDWTTGIYLRSFNRWLRDHASYFDLFYADAMREEAAAVAEIAQQHNKPSVVRCSGNGPLSDWNYATASRAARKTFNAAMRADSVIVPTGIANRALVAAGINRTKVQRIADGVPPALRKEASDRLSARAALGSINSDLRVPTDGRVVLLSGRFDHEHQMMFAAQALAPLLNNRQEVRLWMVGDGPQREEIHHYFAQMGVRSVVALPGSFWHIDELIRAADVAVFPSTCDCLEQRLPHAISGAVPLVVSDSSEMKSYFHELRETDLTVTMFREQNQSSLRECTSSVLDHYEEYSQKAIAIRNFLRRTASREHSIEAHARLFAKLIDEKAGSTRRQDLENNSTGEKETAL